MANTINVTSALVASVIVGTVTGVASVLRDKSNALDGILTGATAGASTCVLGERSKDVKSAHLVAGGLGGYLGSLIVERNDGAFINSFTKAGFGALGAIIATAVMEN